MKIALSACPGPFPRSDGANRTRKTTFKWTKNCLKLLITKPLNHMITRRWTKHTTSTDKLLDCFAEYAIFNAQVPYTTRESKPKHHDFSMLLVASAWKFTTPTLNSIPITGTYSLPSLLHRLGSCESIPVPSGPKITDFAVPYHRHATGQKLSLYRATSTHTASNTQHPCHPILFTQKFTEPMDQHNIQSKPTNDAYSALSSNWIFWS